MMVVFVSFPSLPLFTSPTIKKPTHTQLNELEGVHRGGGERETETETESRLHIITLSLTKTE